jgi:hypothetical protein
MAKSPDKTLRMILLIIEKDTKRLKRIAQTEQLTPADAQTLCRYAATLDSITKQVEKDHNQLKKDLTRLSTDDLIEAYNKEKKV